MSYALLALAAVAFTLYSVSANQVMLAVCLFMFFGAIVTKQWEDSNK